MTITGAVWSLDGATKISHTLKQTFEQIKYTSKHKLSPTEDGSTKKFKVNDASDKNDNPLSALENEIDCGSTCEDLRNEEEMKALTNIFSGLKVNGNVPIDVIIKCDDLGRELANELIGKGAIDVMKVTQDLIRSAVVKS